MNNDTIFLMLTALAVAVAGWGLAQILIGMFQPEKKRLRERLAVDWKRELASGQTRLMIQKQQDHLPGGLGRWGLLQRLDNRVRQAFPKANALHFLGINTLLTAGAGAGLAFLAGPVAAVVGAGLALIFPFLILSHRRSRRQRVLENQLTDALDFLSRILRAGHSLATGFHMMGSELPEPIASEFRRCYDQHNLGQSIDSAMLEMVHRLESSDFAFFVTSVIIQRQTGGDLAELLDKINSVIRARIRLHQHVKALTAEGRLSGLILTLLPPLMFFLIYFLNPEYAQILTGTFRGQMALGGMVVLMAIGQLMIRKIITVKV